MASPRPPPIFSLWLIQSHLRAINIRGCLFYYQTFVMIVHVCITRRLNGEKEKWGAEQADEKLLCLPCVPLIVDSKIQSRLKVAGSQRFWLFLVF